jgi:hypothetical protein
MKGMVMLNILNQLATLLDQFDLPANAEIGLGFSIWANGGEGDCNSGTRLLDVFDTEISELS